LNPFWTAAQRNGDALGLVIYRGEDIPDYATTLVSDFVLPLAADAFWIGDRRVEFSKNRPDRMPVKPGEAVMLRQGEAVLGLRVPWSRGLDGREAQTFLIHDGDAADAVRLAVEQVAAAGRPDFRGTTAGAAFWVRIGTGIKTAGSLPGRKRRWRRIRPESVCRWPALTGRFLWRQTRRGRRPDRWSRHRRVP
jgi:hypothetical protein